MLKIQGGKVWTDSAYGSGAIEGVLEVLNFVSCIHKRAYRNRPLSETYWLVEDFKIREWSNG